MTKPVETNLTRTSHFFHITANFFKRKVLPLDNIERGWGGGGEEGGAKIKAHVTLILLSEKNCLKRFVQDCRP